MSEIETRPRSANRTRVNLTDGPPMFYTPERDPLLPPLQRATELPMSSQSAAHSSPERTISRKEEKKDASGSSKRGHLEEEDEFDGIEDVPLEEVLRSVKRPGSTKTSSNVEKVPIPTLQDLFSDSEDPKENNATGGEKSNVSKMDPPKVRPQSATRHPLSTLSGHGQSSPLPALSSSKRHPASDSPASPLPKTPQTDDLDAIDSWSPSPMSERTRARRGDVNAHASPSPKTKRRRANLIDLSDDTPPKPTSSARKSVKADAGSSSTAKIKSKSKAKEVQVEEEEEEEWNEMDDFHDLDFLDNIDLDNLDIPRPSASGSTAGSTSNPSSGTSKTYDPGRAFRPSSASNPGPEPPNKDWHSIVSHRQRQSSPPSDIISALDDISRPDRLRLISELSVAEQDFYKNHWRRGADKGSKKRGQPDDEGFSDDGGGFNGPEPAEKKKTYNKRAPARRGFGRGRGRGRGAARGRARK